MQILNKHSNKDSILNASLIGVEFEFYSNHEMEETRAQLKKLLGREIYGESNSDFQPDDKSFKIESNLSGGKGLIRLITGDISYRNARIMMIRVLGWIRENGYTTERSSIQLNISFQKDRLEDNNIVSKMSTLKFILEFNEEQVYKLFPSRKDSIYSKSIKWVMPKQESFHFGETSMSELNFNFPNTEYYGVNFNKKNENYLEFKYIGGKDYEDRQDGILYLIDRFILQTWKSCIESSFTDINKIELKKIMQINLPFREILKNHKKIKEYFPKIEIMVDLQESDTVIELHWGRIKDKVVSLMSTSGLKKGVINYDSDLGVIQIKDGEFPVCYELKKVDLVDCSIVGSVFESDLYGCTLEKSYLEFCNLFKGTTVNNSKIKSSYVHGSCNAVNCYIYGKDGIFKGKATGGIFREGMIDKNARFDDTEIVVSKKIN